MASLKSIIAKFRKELRLTFQTQKNIMDVTDRYLVEIEKAASGGGGSTVEVTQIQSTGTKIATITVDDVVTDLYAPNGGSSDVSADDVSYDNTTTGLAADNVQEAVDETLSLIGGVASDVGDLSDLETSAKTDLVSAINEVASGSGGSFTRELLYDKGENSNFPSTITLAHPYTGYDYIEFVTYKDDDGGNTDILDLKVFSKAMFDLALNNTIGSKNNSIMIIGDPHNGAQYARYDVSSSTTLSAGWTNGNWAIYQIYGVKY